MWGGLSDKDTRKLQTLLNKCARIVMGLSRKTRTRTLMTECRWLYVTELVKYHSLLAMWRIIRWNAPYHLGRRVSLVEDNKVRVNNSRILLVRNSFKWHSANDWNELKPGLRDETSYQAFKTRLRRHLIESRPQIVHRRNLPTWD